MMKSSQISLRTYGITTSARDSFLTGVARMVDPFGTLNSEIYRPVSDQMALYSDWRAVGSDIRYAIKKYGKQVKANS
jgi:hypothetical protein